MKKVIAALVAMLVPGAVLAQSIDGPFNSIAAIQSFWSGSSAPNSNAYIYVNGDYLLSHSGFNPALVQHYFLCHSTTVYKAHCGNMRDGDRSLSNLIALFPAEEAIYLNGSLYRAAAPGNSNYADIVTCPTDDSISSYYKVVSYWDGWGPPFASSCY